MISPEEALISLREKFEKDGVAPGCHWRVREVDSGYLFIDNMGYFHNLGFGGVRMEAKHKMEDRYLTPAEVEPLFQKFLDWLALNLPDTKAWAIEWRDNCPPVKCDRESFS